jgi:hypothetical protein
MKGKLVKCNHFYALQIDSDIIAVSLDRETPEHKVNYKYSLSKQNCDEIFGVVDILKLAKEYSFFLSKNARNISCASYHDGFNKAMELNKDKVFTQYDVLDVVNHVLHEMVLIEGFDKEYLFPESVYHEVTTKCSEIKNQPKEIEVEVEMDRIPADLAPGGWDVFPKLDSQGCLILKRVTCL